MPGPPVAKEPSERSNDRYGSVENVWREEMSDGGSGTELPAVEPGCGAVRVERQVGAERMLVMILENVDERVSYLTRALQVAAVVAIAPNFSVARGDAIDGTSESNRESLGASDKPGPVGRLDDEVNVIFLNGKLEEPKTAV